MQTNRSSKLGKNAKGLLMILNQTVNTEKQSTLFFR